MKPLFSAFLLLLFLSCQSEPPPVSHGFYADFFEAVVAKDFPGYFLKDDKDFLTLAENYDKQMYSDSYASKSRSEIEEINEEFDESLEKIKKNYFRRKGKVCYFKVDSNFIRKNDFKTAYFSTFPLKEYFDMKDSLAIINTLNTPMVINSKSLKAGFFNFVFDSTLTHDFSISRIIFSKPYFYQNKALIFYSCRLSETCGHRSSKVCLFENINGYWHRKR